MNPAHDFLMLCNIPSIRGLKAFPPSCPIFVAPYSVLQLGESSAYMETLSHIRSVAKGAAAADAGHSKEERAQVRLNNIRHVGETRPC